MNSNLYKISEVTQHKYYQDGTIFLIFKREDLADMLGICSTTVWRAIKQLKEVGLIEEKDRA